ncbi:hypothetical protein O0L34_g10511 [Tuta absoluta]|nr:hypothetical protein O0L34_g10511 [Tuta absoluta]
MDLSAPQHDEGDAEDDGLYVLIVGDNTDEQTEHQIMEMKQEIHCDELNEYKEEYISEDISDGEDKTKITSKRTYRTRPLPQYMQKSTVRELCEMNPELKDDDEALITTLCKIMTRTICPPPPNYCIDEGEKYLKCSYCDYTLKGKMIPHRETLAIHWQRKHAPRYLKCLACGVHFNRTSTLYAHERTCDAQDAWLVVTARDRLLRLRRTPKRNKSLKKQLRKDQNKPAKNEASKSVTTRKRASKRLTGVKNETSVKSNASKRPKSKLNTEKRNKNLAKLESISMSDSEGYVDNADKKDLLQVFESDSESQSEMKLKYDVSDEDDSDPQHKPTVEEESDDNCSGGDFETKPSVTKNLKEKGKEREVYLNTLRLERPDLLKDKDSLVETLIDIMVKEHAPEPPADFAILNADNLYECSCCDNIQKTRMAAARHWQKKHGTQCYKCYACPSQFRDPGNLYRHEKICKSPYSCLVLKARARTIAWTGRNNRPFINDPDVKPRKRWEHCINRNTRQYICNTCPREFSTLEEVKSHEFEHRGGPHKKPTFRCKECDARYTSAAALCHHRTKKHNYQEGTFLCDKCDRVFTNKMDLRRHMDVHTDKPHGCPKCERRFMQKTDLNIHINRDHLNLPHRFECPLCPQRRYPRMTLLKKHMKKIHDVNIVRGDVNAANKRFKCTKCEKRYASKQDLIYHIDKVHYNLPPPFGCTVCPYRNYKKTDIKKHMSKDHGEEINVKLIKSTLKRPYTIEHYCETDGDQREGPNPDQGAPEVIQISPSAVEKKHACPDCDKRFTNKSDMRSHRDRIHLKMPKPFACQLCPKRCSAMSVLKNHMLKCHQMKIITPKALLETLPNLSEEQLKSAITVTKSAKKTKLDLAQIANQAISPTTIPQFKIIKAKEEESTDNIDEHAVDVDNTVKIEEEYLESEAEYEEILETDEEDISPSEDLVEIVKEHEETINNKPMLVIKDGQAVYMSGENVGYFKKTSNCKINSKTPEVDAQGIVMETNKQLLSYYDRISKNNKPDEKKVRQSARKRKPYSKWT